MVSVLTERMRIYPASREELRMVIVNEEDEDIKKAYSEMLAGCIKMPEQHVWYTVWLMQLKDDKNQIVGDLCFKGLNADGSVEIGYGVKPGYKGRGLATEAVTAMAEWAITQPSVLRIEAETEPENPASQRVLQKSGFIPNGVIGDEGPRFVWKNGGKSGDCAIAAGEQGLEKSPVFPLY